MLIARNGLARQYRNSFLGLLWTLLQPLTMASVYAFIMPMIMRTSTTNYLLYIFVSLPLWAFFSGTLTNVPASILANAETLKRCMISSTVFPIADVLRYTYTFFTSYIVMYLMALCMVRPFAGSWIVLLVPIYFIPVLIIIGSLSVAIAFLAPYLRDLAELILVGMTVLFWLTPVVYPISVLPLHAQALMQWNPFFIMMRPIQMLAYERVLPDADIMLRLLGLTLITVVICSLIFRHCRRNYVYYL